MGDGVTVRVNSTSPMVGAKLSALGLGLEQIKTVDDLMYLCRGVRVLWSSSLAFRWGGSFVLFLCFWRCFFASGPFLGCGFPWFRAYRRGRFLFSLLGARGGVGFVADLEECRYCEGGL